MLVLGSGFTETVVFYKHNWGRVRRGLWVEYVGPTEELMSSAPSCYLLAYMRIIIRARESLESTHVAGSSICRGFKKFLDTALIATVFA